MVNYSIDKLFWENQAKQTISWFVNSHEVFSGSWEENNFKWFAGGKLNVSYNCTDRHLPEKADRLALIWEGNNPNENRNITYQQLHNEVCKLANAMQQSGINKGDRVCIYLPMIPEAVVSMLACARIGAVHTVVFAGFSPEALADRINASQASLLITCDVYYRGDKLIELKNNADIALKKSNTINKVVIVNYDAADVIVKSKINWVDNRDISYRDFTANQPLVNQPEKMDAEDPLFILYTSGSTGKPKGVVHTTAGYLLQVATSFKNVFDYKPTDVYFCAADIGWITGHSYIVYGPLANAATSVIFSGTPAYPNGTRLWQIIDKHCVSIFYTSPTALRMIMAKGNDILKSTSRHSLRILGSVGEPLNPEVWHWYNDYVGNKNCKIVDTWWQTETGSIMLYPSDNNSIPGSVGKSNPHMPVVLLDENGEEITGSGKGILAIAKPWPSQLRSLYNNEDLFFKTYLQPYKGYFFTGDEAFRDKNGNLWITGRIDDVMNISGHRMGSAEIENVLVEHAKIAEAAVIGATHSIKGECIVAFIIVSDEYKNTIISDTELKKLVTNKLGPFACPDKIIVVSDLPKTRSGKIMRRILRKIINGKQDQLGDTSTLANASVVNTLLHEVKVDISGK